MKRDNRRRNRYKKGEEQKILQNKNTQSNKRFKV